MATMFDLSEKLDEELERLQGLMATLDPESDSYKAVSARFKELYALRQEQYIHDMEDETKSSVSNAELDFDKQKHEDEQKTKKKERVFGYIRLGVDITSTIVRAVGTVVSTMIWLDKGYHFEQTGTPTSVTFREGRKSILDSIRDLKNR